MTTHNDLPSMNRTLNGVRPETALIHVTDDWTGSGATWATGIEKITNHLVRDIESKFTQVRWNYVGMRDQKVGENDEYRLKDGSGADLLREQAAAKRVGGGDAEETFAQTVEDGLSDPNVLPNAGATEARGWIMFTTSDTKPADNNSLAELGAELKARKIKFYLIGTPGTNLMELVDASGGFFFELTNTPSEAEVAAISANLAATVAATLRSGATVRKTTRGETVAAP
jgi:hypothetical protein